jgi:hypothetical protein
MVAPPSSRVSRIEDAASDSDGSSAVEGSGSSDSDESTFFQEPDLKVLGVRAEENAWTLAGAVCCSGEEFLVRVTLEQVGESRRRGERGVLLSTRGETFRVCADVSEAIEEREVFDLDNGEDFWDEDGDFDYVAAGMPVGLWRYIYGRIMAPVRIEDDVD